MRQNRALEGDVARRLIRADVDALQQFVELFRVRIFEYSHLHCGHREDAEEVAQEIVLRVCEEAGQLKSAEHARAWVFGIARRVCANYGRRKEAAMGEELSLEHLPGHWYREMTDRHALPDDEAYQHELLKHLGRAIRELPQACREVVFLRDWEGMDWAEVAGIVKQDEGMVKHLLVEGHAMIRGALDAHFQGRKAH